MRKATVAAVIALGAALGQAQEKKGAPTDGVFWAETWEDAKTEAAVRSVPIIFHCHGDGVQAVQTMADEMSKASYAQASRGYVNAIACQSTNHGEETATVDGQQVKRCKRYGAIPCEAHVKMFDAVSHIVGGGKNIMIPTVWILGPGGSIITEKVSSGGQPISCTDILKEAQQALSKIPGEHMGWERWQQILQARRDCKEGWAKGDWKRAMKGATILRQAQSKLLQLEGRDIMNKMSDKGDELLVEARKLLTSNPEEGKKLLHRIADEFKPLSSARQAQEILNSVK